MWIVADWLENRGGPTMYRPTNRAVNVSRFTSESVGCGTVYVPAGNTLLPILMGVVVVTGP
jgi:hypothetical protein